jgi:PhnB protein
MAKKKAKASKTKTKPKAKPKTAKKAKSKMKAKAKSKAKTPQPIPEGYHTVTPYLVLQGAASALDFYKRAFGAKELVRMPGPGGRIMHAEIKIGDSPVMLADEAPERGHRGPHALGGTPVGICLYVEDVDSLAAQAVAAGAKVIMPVTDQFYGDRSGTFTDPYGHQWTIATHKEDVSPEEMKQRMQAMAPPSPPPAPPPTPPPVSAQASAPIN